MAYDRRTVEIPSLPLKIIHPYHLEIVGRGLVLLSNPAISILSNEPHARVIVEEIALLSKAHAIIRKELKRSDSPTTHNPETEYDTALKRICVDNQVKCVIEIDGNREPGIQIRTSKTDERTKEIIELLRAGLAVDFDLHVTVDGTESRRSLAISDDAQVITLSLGSDEIGYRSDAIIRAVADAVGLINTRLGYSESPGDTLD